MMTAEGIQDLKELEHYQRKSSVKCDETAEDIQALKPMQRLNIVCKLIPYVLPKVKAVYSEKGKPDRESKTTISGYNW